MDLLTVLTLGYGVIAVFAIFMTLRERMRHGNHSLRLALAGLVACLLWPLTTATMLVAATIEARTRQPR